MDAQLDFYAPYQMPDGRWIYGVAAANRRAADAGGFNNLAHELVLIGIRLGYDKAVRDNLRRSAR